MKIVYFSGGLGNQMFQYAFYIYLKQKHKRVYMFMYKQQLKFYQVFEILKIFTNIHVSIIHFLGFSKFFYKIFNKINKLNIGLVLWNNFPNDISNETNFNATFFIGYWQLHRLVAPIEKELRGAFVFPAINDKQNQQIVDKIKNCNAISMHIRRGDYLASRWLYGDICTIDYYQKAISYIQQNTIEPVFFLFSDDINWVQENLQIPNAHYIHWNKEENSFRDMQLMSMCKHHIIANSSFSWWGAWLNASTEKIVIAPKKWYNLHNDNTTELMLPKDWIKIGEIKPNISLIISEQIDDNILALILSQAYNDFEILYKHATALQDERIKKNDNPIGNHIFELANNEVLQFKDCNYLKQKVINYFNQILN